MKWLTFLQFSGPSGPNRCLVVEKLGMEIPGEWIIGEGNTKQMNTPEDYATLCLNHFYTTGLFPSKKLSIFICDYTGKFCKKMRTKMLDKNFISQYYTMLYSFALLGQHFLGKEKKITERFDSRIKTILKFIKMNRYKNGFQSLTQSGV